MGIGKSLKGERDAREVRKRLKAIWEKNNFGPDMPFSINKLSRQLADLLGFEIKPGKKASSQIVDHYFSAGLDGLRQSQKTTPKPPKKTEKEKFYTSWEWRTLRMKVIKKHGAVCMCCGATPAHRDMRGKPTKIVVDHIKSLHTHWGLRLDENNLQVLCDECNQGKGAWDSTDFRGENRNETS